MKLSYLAHSKIPSTEANSVHVMKMCHALAKTGIHIELVVPESKIITADPFVFYGVNKIFSIRYRKWKKIKFGNFVYSLKVLRILLKDKTQMVYGRDMTSCFFASLFGFKTIWESHTPVDYMGFLYTKLFKLMVSRRNYLKTVVISSALKDYYVKNYKLLPSRIEVVPDCADEIDINAIPQIDFDDHNYRARVGYIGQLYPGKGMEIISQLIPLCPDVMFHIVGGNNKDINYWKNHLQGCNNVLFHGFVEPFKTTSYGIAMDILIAPYLNNVQGAGGKNSKKNLAKWMSPLKIFDYMSYCKPIITSDLPVLHDVLNKNNSILCSPENIGEWVSAINRLVEDKREAKRIAENANIDFINKFTWDIRAKKIISLYERN